MSSTDSPFVGLKAEKDTMAVEFGSHGIGLPVPEPKRSYAERIWAAAVAAEEQAEAIDCGDGIC